MWSAFPTSDYYEDSAPSRRQQPTTDLPATDRDAQLDHQINEMDDRVQGLRQLQENRSSWLREHPEATARLQGIDRELNPLSDIPEIHQQLSRLLAPRHEPGHHPRMEHGPDFGIDIGL